jgi:outer membrane immunogenic protein
MGGYQRILALSVPVALALGAAQAADLPTHKQAPPALIAPVLPFNWTGPFLGLQGGFAWDGEEVYVPSDSPFEYSVDRHGGFAGVVGGYNYQFSAVVVGVEADYNLANVTGGAAVHGN